MILALDIGNSTTFGGVFDGSKLVRTFRCSTRVQSSSDEFGVFLRNVLRENDLDPGKVEMVLACSAVPDLMHSLANCSIKYFGREPFFVKPGVKTGLKIRYRNQVEVGADRIATAVGALKLMPGKNLIIVDFGTATTFCVVSKDRDYLGGVITPGIQMAMEALDLKTARLPRVEIKRPEEVIGRSTVDSIQSGLYYSAVATIKELTARITRDYFESEPPVVIGTGGFSRLFESEKLLANHIPHLALEGLREIYSMTMS